MGAPRVPSFQMTQGPTVLQLSFTNSESRSHRIGERPHALVPSIEDKRCWIVIRPSGEKEKGTNRFGLPKYLLASPEPSLRIQQMQAPSPTSTELKAICLPSGDHTGGRVTSEGQPAGRIPFHVVSVNIQAIPREPRECQLPSIRREALDYRDIS
jgi:hypothetical protein